MNSSARARSRGSLRGRLLSALVSAGALAALAGCAHVPAGPPAGPPRPAPPVPARPHPGYDARRDSLDAIDLAPLRGRRVVLDPGHGGHFPGSMGMNGLTEAAVNLDVALALRRLLVERGASVLLTRESDRDFLTPADSSLRADLADRMARANAWAPDLFVSIHHNADARGAHDVNEIQTYYALADEGPSLDAARAMHRALTRNLSIAAHRIVPGNYFVLRTSEAPAILTESSYLTNPDVEARLADPGKRRLEAEALFLGIAAYFARGAPEIDTLEVALSPPGTPATGPRGSGPWVSARVRGAFDRVEMSVDGRAVPAVVSGRAIQWRSTRPFESGPHVAALRVGLAGSGWSRLRRAAFTVPMSVGRLSVEFPEQPEWDGRQPLGLRVRVLDPEGLPVRDSLRLRIRDDGTRLAAPADTVVEVRDGVAWAYFRRSGRRPASGAPEVRVRVSLRPRKTSGDPAAPAPPLMGATARTLLRARGLAPRPGAGPLPRTGFARVAPFDSLLRGAPGTREPEPAVRWINRDGFVALPRDTLGRAAVPSLRGYRAVAPDTTWPPRFSAIAGGALIGRRIALDAEGGGDADAGTGPSGARAADLNLDVARALSAFLDAAGAEVLLVREGDHALADIERVRAAEAFGAERYLRIGHRAGVPVLGHWFGSAAGRDWARRTAESLAALGLSAPPVAEEAQYTLQQVGCPALYVSVARVDSAADEERLLAPGARRAEAYALFLGLAREFLPQASFPIDSLEVRDPSGAPLSGASVVLGGALTVQCDRTGRVRFARTEPGPLEATVIDPRREARSILLDSDRGVVLTGPPAR